MNTTRSLRWLIFGLLLFSFSAASFAQIAVGVSVRFGPPAIPVYSQPICPGPGYFWTPGYWAWNDDAGYYWVPGTWVVAPVGMLWTPGYWGWGGGFYRWHPGYWGPHVGFYGGINYGFGYTGVGFFGGEWRGGSFFYNRAVMNVNVTRVTNVYERRVVVNNSRVAFNGGNGGINARPTPEQERFEREPHREALGDQIEHERAASRDRQLFASQNHGRPAIAATGRPGEFSGRDVVRAKAAGGSYRAPKMSPREARVSENEARGDDQRSENNRNAERQNERQNERQSARQNERPGNDRQQNADRPQSREDRGFGRKNTAKQQVRQEQNDTRRQQHENKADQKRQEQAARADQKRQQQAARQDQKRQEQAQRAEQKQKQQAQKKQRQEKKQAPREERSPER